MITAVTLNPALDKVYFIEDFQVGEMYRVGQMVESAGGKGVNVARIVKTLGIDSTAIGFKGGAVGNWIEAQLKTLGVYTGFVEVLGETRTNNNIIDKSKKTETEILELGPIIDGKDMGKFLQIYKKALEISKIVILSGGLPQGVPIDYYRTLIEMANLCGLPVILDASGEALSEGIKAKPYMIKPNIRELEYLLHREFTDTTDIVAACRDIVGDGVGVIMVSMGERGAFLIGDNICKGARMPKVNAINSIGSGDAMIAGFAVGLIEKRKLEDCFRLGVSCGASNAQFMEIGVIDREWVKDQMDRVVIEDCSF